MPLLAAAALPALIAAGDVSGASTRAPLSEPLATLPDAELVVVLADGDEPLVHDAPWARAHTSDGGTVDAEVVVHEDALRAIARRGRAPRSQESALDGALGSLGVMAVRRWVDTPLVAVTVPSRARAVTLDGTAIGLLQAIDAVGARTIVVADGLLRGSGEAARHWDASAAAAVADGDVTSLQALGPDAARAAGAGAWASLCVLLASVRHGGLIVQRSSYELRDGMGHLTAVAGPAR